MTALLAILVLLSSDAGVREAPDGGTGAPPPAGRNAEDEEIIQNLDLLEHLEESQALEMILEIETQRARADR